MQFDLDQRSARLSVGEFADFTLGPRDGGGGPQGIWRAQLGTHWHQQLREQSIAAQTGAEFEVPIDGRIAHRGWTLTLTGRIDQLLRHEQRITLREIKTVTRELPADEAELRADYPSYFIQLATYVALTRVAPAPTASIASRPVINAELVFVETSSGLAQTIALTPADDGLFRAQLERVTEFLDLRQRARERLRHLRFQPAFATLRPGQETTAAELATAVERQPSAILLEAPTGFGKTGVLLEVALGQLRSGHFERLLYVTSKATGQLQLVRQLSAMTDPRVCHVLRDKPGPGVAVWHVRNKSEHCVNHTFHCVRDTCAFLAGAEARWPQSGLARFYLLENQARDLEALRDAGRAANICPYEITRAALAFNDVWIGDYNYVFAPRNRGLFYQQPGFDPARTLLIIDEAHNLPSRVADSYSSTLTATDAFAVGAELHRIRPSAQLVNAWDQWTHFLQTLTVSPALPPADEDDARHLLDHLAKQISSTPLDYAALGPHVADKIWEIPALINELEAFDLSRLWWSPRAGELALTCLDAAPAIGAALREFGGVIFASATFGPVEAFGAACGLNQEPDTPVASTSGPARLGTLTKRDTKKLYKQVTSAAELLRVEEAHEAAAPFVVRAHTPWRDGAYDVAFDARVDTTFQHRSRHYATTAATIAALQEAAKSCVAIFFSSYAYAEAIQREIEDRGAPLRLALQPRLHDLASQAAWVEESLSFSDALFLVLGSSFAESIDLLGGRISHAMVVGPALPEVNAVQRARLAEFNALGRETAFRRVYQIPGMQKVNQALGRLVRAPGQRARVILHCRRFLEPSYASLLAPEYQLGANLLEDADLRAWLDRPQSQLA